MKKGMIFDFYREGQKTVRVVAINDKQARNLETGIIYDDIDFKNEVDEIIIDDIFNYPF